MKISISSNFYCAKKPKFWQQFFLNDDKVRRILRKIWKKMMGNFFSRALLFHHATGKFDVNPDSWTSDFDSKYEILSEI